MRGLREPYKEWMTAQCSACHGRQQALNRWGWSLQASLNRMGWTAVAALAWLLWRFKPDAALIDSDSAVAQTGESSAAASPIRTG